MMRRSGVAAVVLLLSACAGVPMPKVETLSPKQVQHGPSRPVMFRKLVVKIPRGEVIGKIQAGLACVNHSTLTWRGGRAVVPDEDFGEVLREELIAAGYMVVGDPPALFEDPSAWKAEYLVAGLIRDVKANVCYPWGGFGNFTTAKGEAWVDVEWQIYSRRTRSVELRLSTQGTAKSGEQPDGGIEAIAQAFRAASRNLLARPT